MVCQWKVDTRRTKHVLRLLGVGGYMCYALIPVVFLSTGMSVEYMSFVVFRILVQVKLVKGAPNWGAPLHFQGKAPDRLRFV